MYVCIYVYVCVYIYFLKKWEPVHCYTKIAPDLHMGSTVVNTLRAFRLSQEPILIMKLGTWQVLKP